MGATRLIRVGCEFRYRAEIATPAVFQVQPRDAELVAVLRQAWEAVPATGLHGYTDLYGNQCQRLLLPAGDSQVRYNALVAVPDAAEEVDPGASERRRRPSCLMTHSPTHCRAVIACQRSLLMRPGSCSGARSLATGGCRRFATTCTVTSHLRFGYGSTRASTSAVQAYASGLGVCRDFVHLAITFCRALSIPARYAFGYLPYIDVPPAPEPMDFAAWMEVYHDGKWWTFDPRNNAVRKGRVLVGRGRDAVDVAMVTTFGGHVLRSMTVLAEETT